MLIRKRKFQFLISNSNYNIMKKFILISFCAACFFSGCATNSKFSELSDDDFDVFHKTFQGTLMDMEVEEFNDNGPKAYMKLTVMKQPDGKLRKFYIYAQEKSDLLKVRRYYNELVKGDVVEVDMGFIDDNQPEEIFEFVKKISD